MSVKRVERDDDFYKGQVDFLDPRPRQARSVTFIHKHVAYLDARIVKVILPEGAQENDNVNPLDIKFEHHDDGKIYLKVVYNDVPFKQRLRVMRDRYHFVNLDMKSVMPEFEKEPITGLCFTGAYPVLDRFFLQDGKPASCLEKYYELFSPTLLYNTDKTASLDGMYLEKIAAMSLVLASHAASIGEVLEFETFFNQFIQELQDDYGIEPNVTVDPLHTDLWSQFSKIRLFILSKSIN